MRTNTFILNYGLAFWLSVAAFALAQEASTPPAGKRPIWPAQTSGLTPEMEKKALESIRQIHPKLVEHLENRKSADPLSYFGELRKAILEMYDVGMLLNTNLEAREQEAMKSRKEDQALLAEKLAREWAVAKKMELDKMRKQDPARIEREEKIHALELNSQEMAISYRNAQDEAARKTIRANLGNVVTQLFDLREMNRQDDVKRTEADLQRLKETLDQRQKNRAAIIERRVQQLIGEVRAMEWE
jgi:hypothetical protein